MPDESLGERLNRLAQEKKSQQEAEKAVRRTQDQINQFIFANARPAFDDLLKLVETRAQGVNPSLQDLPHFEWNKGSHYVKQGSVAAFFSFHQPVLNAAPISFHISFGREPAGFYADVFSEAPEPERYQLEPAMEQNPDRIVWNGDLGEMSSETLVDFVLTHLTEYYLAHKSS
ncbi:MAG TPA: hypothetical protein VMH80_08075 [Bryobacteraceae bacterium]|nr:hypothetical protein [Bryobacteraceae bacterium]